jgi:hypothetical protein
MSKFVTRFLPLLLLVCFYADNAGAQQTALPPNLDLGLGDAVVSGFSGTLAPDASTPRPANKSATDLTFINPDGPSARIVDLRKMSARDSASHSTMRPLPTSISPPARLSACRSLAVGAMGYPNEVTNAKTSETSHEYQS